MIHGDYLGALEEHVLQEMCCSIGFGRLESAASINPHANACGLGEGLSLRSYPHTIWQSGHLQRRHAIFDAGKKLCLSAMAAALQVGRLSLADDSIATSEVY